MTATFTGTPSLTTVRRQLLMDAKAKMDMGARIKELRDNSPETNRSIADYVGVGERSVAAWLAGDGISYKNAEKVAKLFEVDIDWIWRGRREKGATPQILGDLNPSRDAALIRIESKLDLILAHLGLDAAPQPRPGEAAADLAADVADRAAQHSASGQTRRARQAKPKRRAAG